jgi:hypothetical protein
MLSRSIELALCLVVLSHCATADILFVPDDFLEVQEALNSTIPDDTVIVRSGVYFGEIVIPAWNVTLASEYLLTHDEQYIETCVIRPDSSAQNIRCLDTALPGEGAPRLTLAGVTIQQGRLVETGSQGGGLRIRERVAKLDHCRFKSCLAVFGGGLYAEHSTLDMVECSFFGDDAIGVGRHVYLNNVNARFDACSILATAFLSPPPTNNADIGLLDGSLVMSNCIVRGLGASEGPTTIISMSDGSVVSRLELRNCLIQANQIARLISSGSRAGPVYFTMDSCSFLDNSVSFGVFGDWEHDSLRFARIRANQFEGTRRPAGVSGAGIFAFTRPSSNLVMEENVFVNNQGGAFSCLQITGEHNPEIFRAQRNYFSLNSNFNVSSPPGGAIFTTGLGPGIFEYNSLAENAGHAFDTWEFGADGYALHNWWGDSTGPFVAGEHETGLGDTTDTDTIYDEWLASEDEIPDTSSYPDAARTPPAISAEWQVSRIYPNPFNSELRVELIGRSGPDLQIKLFDLLGREADTLHEGRLQSGTITYSAPSTLAAGVYFLRVRDRFHSETRKVLFLK